MAKKSSSGDAIRQSILEDVFIFFQRNADYPIAEDFRLDHESSIKACDQLEREGILDRMSGKYVFHLSPYISSSFWRAEERTINRLFPKLKALYRKNRHNGFPAAVLREGLPIGVKPFDLKRSLVIMLRLDLIRGLTRDANTPADEYTTYCVPERILLFDSITQLITEARERGDYLVTLDKGAAAPPPLPKGLFGVLKSAANQPIAGINYASHPMVASVSSRLFENRHYAEAVEAVLKAVISRVKNRLVAMGEDPGDGGDGMMGIAFGAEKREPRIRFNSMSTREERDEHRGIFFLFKGIVGIRNRKAHENVTLNDPARAADYIHLGSLLMRLLDISETAKTSNRRGRRTQEPSPKP